MFPVLNIFQLFLGLDSICPTLPARMSSKERHIMTTDNQLELGFNSGITCQGANGLQPHGRIARANWWFARMRNIVENAMDWSAGTEPRPEQIWMPGTNREVKV